MDEPLAISSLLPGGTKRGNIFQIPLKKQETKTRRIVVRQPPATPTKTEWNYKDWTANVGGEATTTQ